MFVCVCVCSVNQKSLTPFLFQNISFLLPTHSREVNKNIYPSLTQRHTYTQLQIAHSLVYIYIYIYIYIYAKLFERIELQSSSNELSTRVSGRV